MTFQRYSDKVGLWATVFGFTMLGVAFFLRWKSALADTPFTVLAVIGAGMVAPTFILDALRARFGAKPANDAAPPEAPHGPA